MERCFIREMCLRWEGLLWEYDSKRRRLRCWIIICYFQGKGQKSDFGLRAVLFLELNCKNFKDWNLKFSSASLLPTCSWYGSLRRWGKKSRACCCEGLRHCWWPQVNGMFLWADQVSPDPLMTIPVWATTENLIEERIPCVCVCVFGLTWAHLLQWRVLFHLASPAPRSPSRTPHLSALRRAGGGRSACHRPGWASPWSESKRRAFAALQAKKDKL